VTERPPHVPVLLDEVLALLAPSPGARILDGTLGAGGHAFALLERAGEGASLLGLDRDPAAIELARARLEPLRARARVELAHASFEEAPEVAALSGLGPFDRILLDLGVSSMQLDRPERGFTFMAEGPLDMRMDPGAGTTAAELVNELEEQELADLIYHLGDEPASRRIAHAIVQARKAGPIATTKRLADVVTPAAGTPRRGRKRLKIHPATRTFQALRIAVNDELRAIERGLPRLFELLAPGGRLAVIAFHSLEDRLVKRFFRELASARAARRLTKKPIRPGDDEVARNPRARSARLRAVEKAVPGQGRRRRS
jgi:16S rRNA (cytosine1402-N4)-methyltransferase